MVMTERQDCARETCSKNVRDLLMYMASVWVLPSDWVLPSRSEPAKSTKLSLETVYLASDCTRDLGRNKY